MTADTKTPDPAAAASNDADYDGPLPLFADFMNMLGEHSGVVTGAAERGTGVRLTVTELALDMPMELRVRERGDGGVALRGGPPTQTVETTVFPVLHRLRVHLALTEILEHGPNRGLREGAPDGSHAVE